MNPYYIYIFAVFALAAFSAVTAFWAVSLVPANPEKWEKLPRNVWWGVVFAALSLAWCVPHSKPIAPDFMVKWLIPIAVVCLWLAYQFLDYLFSRAFGGFLILAAHYFLYASFYYHAPIKPFFSILCFAMGTLGIFFCGKPYLMRDFIRKLASSQRWRYSAAAVAIVYFITSLLVGILHLTK